MSIYNDIRGALEQQLLTVTGLPVVFYEGVKNRPVVGTPFVEPVLVPSSSRPSTMGDQHVVLHEGLFMVSLAYPQGVGAGVAEAMADAVKTVFKASQISTLNSTTVRFRYAERRPTLHDADWLRIPVAIGWFIFDDRY